MGSCSSIACWRTEVLMVRVEQLAGGHLCSMEKSQLGGF